MLKTIVDLLRPKHWIKNAFVLAPLIFSFQFLIFPQLLYAIMALISFCLVSSAVYITNDILDIQQDRYHPYKRTRPIASGKISVRTGIFLVVLLFTLAIGLAFFLSFAFVGIISLYASLNLLYSYYLKRVVLIDVFTIAIGFILRVVGGGVAINVEVSVWLLLVTLFISLFLGFSKRYSEIVQDNSINYRPVLSSYNKQTLLMLITLNAGITIVLYTLYAIDPEVATRFYSSRLLYSLPLVVFGIFRYLLRVTKEGAGGDVAEVVTEDKFIIIVVIIWLISVGWAYRW